MNGLRRPRGVARTVFLTLGIVVCVEFLVMFLVPHGASTLVEAVWDTVLLTALGGPLLWWLLVRPLREAAETEHERCEAIIRTASDAVVTFDEGGTILSFNPAAERMFGFGAAEAIGGNLRMLMPSPHREEHEGHLRRFLETREGRLLGSTRPLEALRKDGTRFPIELTLSLARDRPPLVFTAFIRDVTERGLLEERVRESQKMEAVGKLAGGVAHEFNNLLTVVLGHADLMLARTAGNEAHRRSLGEIRKAGEHGGSLARRLLAFGRRQMLAPEVLDLNGVIRDMADPIRRRVGEGVRLETRLEPGLWRVRADPGQISELILDLADNARDAMPEGGLLTLETSNAEVGGEEAAARHLGNGGPHALLTVRDTGKGIPAEIQPRIFEPFFTTKEQGKGTGLGLATAYGIVKQSGGAILLESEVGRGTTFRIYLPRHAEAPALPRPGAAPAPVPEPREEKTVLLVEDDAAVRGLARETLCGAGFRVYEAGDGAQALEILGRGAEPVDLLLTDVVMPSMTGWDLARHARTLRPDLKVLFVSGYAHEGVREGIRPDAGDRFLGKPYSPGALVRRVREMTGAGAGTVLPGEAAGPRDGPRGSTG